MGGKTTKGHLIVLVGPSGVGKSTLSLKLAERMHLKYIVSATTRKQNEKDHLQHFVPPLDRAVIALSHVQNRVSELVGERAR